MALLLSVSAAAIVSSTGTRAAVAPAGSTWTGNTGDTLWQTAGNWNPNTVPFLSALFDVSPNSAVTINTHEQVGSISFSSAASAYTFTFAPNAPATVFDVGTGVFNNSTQTQLFQMPEIGGSDPAAGSSLEFHLTSTASGGSMPVSYSITQGAIVFHDASTAGTAVIAINGGSTHAGQGSFHDSSTAGSASIAINAGAGLLFQDGSTGGTATLSANGGSIDFLDTSDPTGARLIANAAGQIRFDHPSAANNSAGSIEGSGTFSLGGGGSALTNLTVGSNNLSTTVSGTINGDGGLNKTGTGTLTLSGTNTYLGGTKISGGAISVSADANLGASSGVLAFSNNGTLAVTGTGFTTSRNVTIGSTGGTIDVASGGTLTMTASLIGGGALIKSGAGTLILTSSNVYGGGTTISGGVLQADAATGWGNGAIVDNAELLLRQDSDATFLRTVSGTGNITKAGASTITMFGSNTYSGGTFIVKGALSGGVNAFGTGPIVLGSGTVDSVQSRGNLILNQTSNVAAASVSESAIGPQPQAATSFAAAITGFGSLTKQGTDVVTLSGLNTYDGGTTISAGGLIGTTSSFGTGAIAVTSGTTLEIAQSTDGTFGGDITGAGTLTKSGTGAATLTGNIALTGQTTISGGTLAYGDGTHGGAPGGDIAIASGATAAFALPGTQTYAGHVTGTGTLLVNSPTNLILTTNSSFAGTTDIDTGAVLQFGNGGATGSLASGGTLQVDGRLVINRSAALRYDGPLFGDGTIEVAGTGLVTFTDSTATSFYSGGLIVDSGASLQLGDGDVVPDVVGNAVDNGHLILKLNGTAQYDGILSGSGTLELAGPAKIVATADNTLSGAATIDAGATLQLGKGGAGGSVAGAIVDNGVLIFNHAASFTLPGAISGTGTLEVAGTGTAILTGDGPLSGRTTIDTGASLQLGNGGATGSLGGDIADDGRLVINHSGSFTLANTLIGSGALEIAGGTTLLTVNSAFVGATTIDSGATLQLGNGGTSGSTAGNFVDNGHLVLSRSDTVTSTASLSGTGTFDLNGGGTLIFNGDGRGFTGTTNLNAGTLRVGDASTPGATLGGALKVASGATLQGHGTIGGALTNAGTVQPGGTIGVLTVNGNYTQTGTLNIEVSPTDASKLQVNGAATLGGTLALTFDPGTYAAQTYQIVSATGGVSGSFASVTGTVPSATLTQSIAYGANATSLVLAVPVVVIVAPKNPGIYPSLAEASTTANQDSTDLLLGRLAYAQDSGLWITAFGDNDQVGGNGALPGWHSTTGGGFAGYDLAVSGSAMIGISGGYATTSLSTAGGDGAIDEPHVTVYGRVGIGGIGVAALADFGFPSESGNRAASAAATANGRRSANATTVAVQAMFDTFALRGFSVGPRAGISYLSLTQGAFSETGAGGLDVAGSRSGIDSLRPFVGLHGAHDFAMGEDAPLRLTLDLSYSRELLDTTGKQTLIASDGTLFASAGSLSGRDSVSLRAALARQIAPGLDLAFSYEVQGGRLFGQEIAVEVKHPL